jgi:hypothetical protein
MTTETYRRILQALAETNVKIAKEEARAADLRPDHVWVLLGEWKAHAARLEAKLAIEDDLNDFNYVGSRHHY